IGGRRDGVCHGSGQSRAGRIHFVAAASSRSALIVVIDNVRCRLLIAFALLPLLVSTGGVAAQSNDVTGLHFVADNTVTASTAANAAPLSPIQLSRVDGSPSGHT